MIIELNSLADFKHYFITVDGFTNPKIKYSTLSVDDGKLRQDLNVLSINNT